MFIIIDNARKKCYNYTKSNCFFRQLFYIDKGENIMFCKQCGSELPENAGFCPNCGRKTKAKPSDNSPVNQTSLSTEKPAIKAAGNKKVLIAVTAAVVLAVAALVVVLIIKNEPTVSPNGFQPNSFAPNTYTSDTANPGSKNDLVKIKLNLSVEQNDFFAKYGVDVLLNGVTLKTINQGETFSKEIEVKKGSFTIKFVKNRSSSDETLNFQRDTVEPAEYTEYIDRDCEITLKVKTHKLKIELLK